MLIRLFGRISIAGKPVSAQKHACMLAALAACPGEPVSAADLIDRIWDGDPPTTALSVLYSQIARMRAWLRDHPAEIRRTSGGYVLDADPGEIDLHHARSLAARADLETASVPLWREATALVQGEALAGVKGRWADQFREAMHRERTGWRTARFTAELAAGHHAAVIDELAAAAQAEPLAESIAAVYMLALYRCERAAEALVVFDELRHRLRDELGADPSPQLRELHRRVLDHDPELASPASREPLPLPATISTFTGRDRELSILDSLTDGETGLATLIGPAGIGKTTLAVRWAHGVRDRFPDGQLYVNLRGFDPAGQAMPAGEGLRTLLELLRIPPQQIPTTLEAQSGLYRSRLAGARMLVLLDNARDADQVRPLLAGTPGSLTLVTSRNQLTGLVTAAGAQPIRLEALDEGQARGLLAQRLGTRRVDAEPDAVDQIIAACGGLPLALAIVAARAATGPGFPLAAFAKELKDTRDRLDALVGTDPATDIRAVFSWSYEALPPAAGGLFRLLGLHSGPTIGVAAAASLAAVPPTRARRLLAELTGAHLITEPTPGRYAMHDLVRAYAAELAESTDSREERQSALSRLFDHYLHTGHHAATLMNRSRTEDSPPDAHPGTAVGVLSSRADADAWFDQEREALLATIHQAANNGSHVSCWHLTRTVADYLERRGRWQEALTSHLAGLDAAIRHGDPAMRARSHDNLALNHIRLRQFQQAQVHMHQSVRLYTALGSQFGLMRSHLLLALAHDRQGQHPDALRHSQLALTVAEAVGDLHGQVASLNGVAWQHALIGEYHKCVAFCERALALPTEPQRFHASTLDTLGYAYHCLNQYREAIASYERAVALFRELGVRLGEARSLVKLADSHDALEEHAAARKARQEALEVFTDLDHPDAVDLRKKLGLSGAAAQTV